jgi:hypothetical protein
MALQQSLYASRLVHFSSNSGLACLKPHHAAVVKSRGGERWGKAALTRQVSDEKVSGSEALMTPRNAFQWL